VENSIETRVSANLSELYERDAVNDEKVSGVEIINHKCSPLLEEKWSGIFNSVLQLVTGFKFWVSNCGGGEIFGTSPERPWGPPDFLYEEYLVSFQGLKQPGRGVDHPSPSSAEVRERVELYLYSLSGSSWPVLRRTLPFFT
jgi:hypothetical protein